MTTSHGSAEQSPDHPLNFDPEFAAATRVTTDSSGYRVRHFSAGPDSSLHLTVPAPVPEVSIVRSNPGSRSKVAVTAWFSSIVNSHASPSQSPENSMNSEPGSGTGISVTSVPSG